MICTQELKLCYTAKDLFGKSRENLGSLKRDWILKAHHSTREEMTNDVAAYMRYYNLDRLHTANGDMSPVEFENCKNKVSTFG